MITVAIILALLTVLVVTDSRSGDDPPSDHSP